MWQVTQSKKKNFIYGPTRHKTNKFVPPSQAIVLGWILVHQSWSIPVTLFFSRGGDGGTGLV